MSEDKDDDMDLQASSAFPPNTDPISDPMKDIRAVLPRTFSREDLAWATKKAKQAADLKGEPITWSVAKERAYGYFKAICGVPPYDKTVIFAPPVKIKVKKQPKTKRMAGQWWKITMKTNRERTKIMKARMEILAKMAANKAVSEENKTDGSD
jgi:hypothetical protein